MIRSFFNEHKRQLPSRIELVVVERQVKSIDVLCIINEKYAILIEDKTTSINHSNQLQRYYETIKADFEEENILPIYFKSGDQTCYQSILADGIAPFTRDKILAVLRSYTGSNYILRDYYEHLNALEKRVNLFRTSPIESPWKGDAWIGFYKELQKHFVDGRWYYVDNAAGGHYVFSWGAQGDNDCQQYLEYSSHDRLTIRIRVTEQGAKVPKELHIAWVRHFIDAGNDLEMNVSKSPFRNGRSVAVCKLNDSYRVGSNCGLDINRTVAKLKTVTEFLASCSRDYLKQQAA